MGSEVHFLHRKTAFTRLSGQKGTDKLLPPIRTQSKTSRKNTNREYNSKKKTKAYRTRDDAVIITITRTNERIMRKSLNRHKYMNRKKEHTCALLATRNSLSRVEHIS